MCKRRSEVEILNLNFSNVLGKIKVLNGMNNGPTKPSVRGMSNFESYKALEIPYARNHDASFCTSYGGEHTVDVHRIFKNFDADENNPENYVFAPTDEYVRNTFEAGTKVFYRLGASIEHGYKYGTYPPKDFIKWARICEHIIRHYTEGWADGFEYDIEYWEIWNEPDCHNTDGSNPCWQGTAKQFIDFFEVVAKHLKSVFPHLKIGGPAFCHSRFHEENANDFKLAFLRAVKQREIPLDFYSFHGYLKNAESVFELSEAAMKSLEIAGLKKPELIYNEWNYVREWVGPAYVYSRDMARGIKGAAFNTAVMCATQASDIDMLMYYDARPSNWCGLFESYSLKPLKPYYGYYLFKEIAKLGGWVKTDSRIGNVWAIAASDGTDGALMLAHYNDSDDIPPENVTVNVSRNSGKVGTRVEYYLLDGQNNGELLREEIFTSDSFVLHLNMKLFDTYLIKFISI
ncbi:MAG: hypothetical protein E7612_08900 [Ruminococcaceae bacterium]|nr:hypothetical protein [Oscillospiraceae bacterium]